MAEHRGKLRQRRADGFLGGAERQSSVQVAAVHVVHVQDDRCLRGLEVLSQYRASGWRSDSVSKMRSCQGETSLSRGKESDRLAGVLVDRRNEVIRVQRSEERMLHVVCALRHVVG